MTDIEESDNPFTKIMVEIKGASIVNITDLPMEQYEYFLELTHKLRLAYIAVKPIGNYAVCPQCSGNGGGVTDDGWEVCKCQKNNQQQENLHTEWQCPNCGNFTKESNYLCCCSQACLKSWLDKTNIIND